MVKSKIPVDIKVDPDLKTQFESLKEIHEMTISDALGIGMKEVIHKTQSPQEIHHRIDELELEIRKINAAYGCALGGQAESENNKTDFRCRHDAGFYHDGIAYNIKTDKMDLRKVKITCPICGREFAALLSKFTKPIRHYFLDSDCEMPAVEMKTFCRKCKSEITFKLDCG